MVSHHILSNLHLRAAITLLVLSPLIPGCGGGELELVDFSRLPVRTVSPEELVLQVNRDGNAVSALKGKLEMGLQKGAGEETKRCSGLLLAGRSPERGLYVKGYKRLIPTFFTLVSDGREFWFHVPRDDVVYTGPLEFSWSPDDSLELYLNAGDLLRALFVRPVDTGAAFEVESEDSAYVVTVYAGGAVTRKLWVERKRFTVVRELYYDDGGIEQLEIQRSGYVDLEGPLYPSSLVLRDLISGSSVFLDFNSITLDPEDLPDGVFRFGIPDDVEVRRVGSPRMET